MTPTLRKPLGVLLILFMLALWAMLTVTLIGLVTPAHWLVELLLYLAAGIGWLWALPMRRMLLWMETGRFR